MLREVVDYILLNRVEFLQALNRHILLSFTAVLISLIICLPLGIALRNNEKLSEIVMNITSYGRMIPSFVVLALAMPLMGIGFWSSLIALILLACPPIIINLFSGFKEIDKDIVESAKGMGMDRNQVLTKIELPLAFPIILNGIRIASVEVIASASLAAIIGGGGLGDFIISGLSTANNSLLLVGAIPVSVMAIILSMIFEFIIRRVQTNNK